MEELQFFLMKNKPKNIKPSPVNFVSEKIWQELLWYYTLILN